MINRFVVVVAIATVFWSHPQVAAAKPAKPVVTLLYTLDGKGDLSFNDSAARAVPEVKRRFGVTVKEVEPKNAVDIGKQIDKAVSAGSSLIIGIGFGLKEEVEAGAKRHKQVHFAMIEVEAKAPNLASVVFKEHEGSYLMGYLAARKSATKKIGFIGGMPIAPIERFLKGYEQGAKKALPSVKLEKNYLGESTEFSVWNNPTKAKQSARELYSQGVDVIYAVSGGSNTGIFAAAREVKRYAIGVDKNQNGIEPGYILTSLVKRIDKAVIQLVEAEAKGKFKAATIWLGMKEGALEVALDEYSNKLLSVKLQNDVEALRKKIVSGAIKVAQE